MPIEFTTVESEPFYLEELDSLWVEIEHRVSSGFVNYLEWLKKSHPGKIDELYSHLDTLVHDASPVDWMRDEYFWEWGMKFSDEQGEDLIHFSLQKNRQRNHELRDEFEEYDDTLQRQSQSLYKKNLEIARLKTQRAILSILAAVGIGAYGVEKIMDVRWAKPTNENIEPLRQHKEAFSPKSSVIHSPIPSSAARVRHGDPDIIKRVRASFNALIEPEMREL